MLVITVLILTLLTSCLKGKKYESIEQMKSDLIGFYEVSGSNKKIIITDKQVIQYDIDEVFKRPSESDTDFNFDAYFNKYFYGTNYNTLSVEEFFEQDFIKITIIDADFNPTKSTVGKIFIKDTGEVLLNKNEKNLMTKVSSECDFPNNEIQENFDEYISFLIDFEVKTIKNEAVNDYNEKISNLKSKSESTNSSHSRSFASKDTVVECCYDALLKNGIKDPYTAHLISYSDVEYDSYGRVYCAIVFEAKNGLGLYVTTLKHVVLQSCSYSGTYNFNVFFSSDSEYEAKLLNGWGEDPNADSTKEPKYKEAIDYIKQSKYNSDRQILSELGDYRNSRSLLSDVDDVLSATKYNNGITLYSEKDYSGAKEILSRIPYYLKSKRLIELCGFVENSEKYKEAEELFLNRDYEAAKTLYDKLGDFRDSTEKANECTTNLLNYAKDLIDEGDYSKALEILNKMKSDDTTKSLIEKCNIGITEQQYNKAVEMFNDGKFDEAKKQFEQLSGYKDSTEWIEKCGEGAIELKYEIAVKLFNSGKYTESKTTFEKLTNYADSAEWILKCDEKIMEQKYDNAVSLFENGKFEEAKSEFERLKDFKDSNQWISKCDDKITEEKYKNAISLFESGKYEEAKTAFLHLNGFGESEKYIEKCNKVASQKRYDEARSLFDQGKYDSAKVIFVSLGDFSDSKTFAEKCDNAIKENEYQKAISLFNSGDYEKAKAAFSALDGFKDSKAYISKCDNAVKEKAYQAAIKLYNNGDYEKAKSAFIELNGYSDSKNYITKCENGIKEKAYQAAIKLYNSGDYDKAKAAFTNLGNYSDSKSYITKCENAIKEKAYQSALALYNSAEYVKAQAAFSALGDYSDSKAYVEKCKDKQYNQALIMYKDAINESYWYTRETKLKEARSIFESLGNYKNSKKQADYCSYRLIYTFKEDEKYGGWTITIYNLDNAPDSWKRTDNWVYPSEIDGKKVTTIGKHCSLYSQFLAEHPNIKSETFPDTIKCVGYKAFEYCEVEKIYLPSSIEEIDSWGIRGSDRYSCKSNFYIDVKDIDRFTDGYKSYFRVGGNIYYRGTDGEWVYYTGVSDWYGY